MTKSDVHDGEPQKEQAFRDPSSKAERFRLDSPLKARRFL